MPSYIPYDKSHYKPSKDQLVKLVQDLHNEAEICHRDLYSMNIVMLDTRPYLIDFETSTFVLPDWKCYDLCGPNEDVWMPAIHAKARHLPNGVWWNHSPRGRLSLKQTYGALEAEACA